MRASCRGSGLLIVVTGNHFLRKRREGEEAPPPRQWQDVAGGDALPVLSRLIGYGLAKHAWPYA